jgi:putative ubiquitin-RnfH superfamily antitoxin RatB of RatAB toxin-antitoxin module
VAEEIIEVEVAYATPQAQCILKVRGEPGLTLKQAVERSNILERFPEIDLTQAKMGVFGKLATPDTKLVDGDRVEIYRPLIADPKEARKRRAAEGKPMRKGGGSAA